MVCAYEQVNSWLSELGQSLNTRLTLDEEGYCFLSQGNNASSLMIVASRNSEYFVITVDVLPLVESQKHNVFEKAMKLNLYQQHTLGGSISYDEQSNAVVLSYLRLVEHTNFNEFQNIINNLIDRADYLRSQILVDTGKAKQYANQHAATDLHAALRV